VRIPDSSAMVQGVVEGTIEWVPDPDFGYEVATSVPGVEDGELLQPRLLYDRLGRIGEYEALVRRLKGERAEYLAGYSALRSEVIAGIQG